MAQGRYSPARTNVGTLRRATLMVQIRFRVRHGDMITRIVHDVDRPKLSGPTAAPRRGRDFSTLASCVRPQPTLLLVRFLPSGPLWFTDRLACQTQPPLARARVRAGSAPCFVLGGIGVVSLGGGVMSSRDGLGPKKGAIVEALGTGRREKRRRSERRQDGGDKGKVPCMMTTFAVAGCRRRGAWHLPANASRDQSAGTRDGPRGGAVSSFLSSSGPLDAVLFALLRSEGGGVCDAEFSWTWVWKGENFSFTRNEAV